MKCRFKTERDSKWWSLSLMPFLLLMAAMSDFGLADEPVDFERDVRPIFQTRCAECHGATRRESGLTVLARSTLLKGGESGEAAIVPGKASESLLFQMVSGADSERRMPPKGEPLGAMQIDVLRRWIDQGAKMPDRMEDAVLNADHWSLKPIVRPALPDVSGVANGKSFVRNPIDSFVLQRLRQAGLKPSQQADRRTLIRRLFFVIEGLPPSPEEVDRFVNDPSDDAWPRLVEQVLNSPRYGERWARHWLDAIRFGETHGFETNRERPHAWPYRDYVIDAFNTDKPYDQFVREQIAGDALGADVATGFLVAGPYDLVKSPDINLTLMQRQDELSDLINTTGTAFLGLTLGCARCHNHKFDPVTQKDFYSLQAVFAGVQHGDRSLPMPTDQLRKLKETEQKIAELRSKLAVFIPQPDPTKPMSREPVNFARNVEQFPATEVKFVRFTVLATNNGSEPCLDEIEVFANGENVALASRGTKATASSSLPGYEIHQLEHIFDGKYGNARSWISKEPGAGWVQLELSAPAKIDRMEWGRDREQKFADRLAVKYRIEGALKSGEWKLLASSDDRRPFAGAAPPKPDEPEYRFDGLPEEKAREGRAWLAELDSLKKQRETLTVAPTIYAGRFEQPGPTFRLYRGDPQAKREQVRPDTIEVLGSLRLDESAPEQQRRLKLAEWLTSPQNPLTARVIVNRLWQYHFGTGIVDTPGDFGANGSRPSHPELLDWLAAELMQSTQSEIKGHDRAWSLKRIHRLILLSGTWQQSSEPQPEALKVDADSRLLWRFPPRRLEAEAIHDSMLAASGVIDLRMGGPGYSGFDVQAENVRHYFPKTAFGPDDWRRMIYMTKVRQEQDATFGVFDCPDASQVMPRRPRSTTPLQALNLLNSAFVLQQAELLEKRLRTEAGADPAAQVRRAFRLAFAREPDADELADAVSLVQSNGLASLCRALLNANEFLFVP